MSLSDCPAEIIIDIFKSFDIISSATALSQISRKFYAIWRTNIISICEEVLPQGIEYKGQVHQILEELKESVLVPSQNLAEGQTDADSLPAKSIFSIAENAFSKVQMDTDALRPRGRFFMDRRIAAFDESSHSRFLLSYYHTMSIMHLASMTPSDMNETLSPLQLLDFLRTNEATIRILKTAISEPWDIFDTTDFFDNFDYMKDLKSELKGIIKNQQSFHDLSNRNPYIEAEDRVRLKIRETKGIILANFLPLIFPRSSSYT